MNHQDVGFSCGCWKYGSILLTFTTRETFYTCSTPRCAYPYSTELLNRNRKVDTVRKSRDEEFGIFAFGPRSSYAEAVIRH